MTSGPRKKPPAVIESVDDAPLENGNGKAPAVRPAQPEPKTFRDALDLSKLQFGQKLIGWCIFVILALTIIGHFWPRDSSILSSTIELLKLVTTTALGFVFAKTMVAEEKSKENSV